MPTAELPAFLQEFINHRKHTTDKDLSQAAKKKLGVTDKKGQQEIEMAIDGIIEKKPKAKIVRNYFKERIKDLTAVKMK
tara:strand:+ start:115 stop:351 length:237 start_codon:yes stop_codon:yes gene_type:complete